MQADLQPQYTKVETAWRPPAARLQPHISRYGGFHIRGIAPGVMRGLPSRHITLMIGLGTPFNIAGVGTRNSFVGGLHAAPAIVRHGDQVSGIRLSLTPLGVRSLLGMPARALAGQVVELGDVMGSRADGLQERLNYAPSWTKRFDILDEVFARDLADLNAPRELSWAWRKLIAHQGHCRIDALAEEVGWSRRHFTQRFEAELGVAPKTLARVMRFEHACALIKRVCPALAEVAATCGYHDQAHMTREWQALAGCSPKAWIAEELPFVQDYELAGMHTDT